MYKKANHSEHLKHTASANLTQPRCDTDTTPTDGRCPGGGVPLHHPATTGLPPRGLTGQQREQRSAATVAGGGRLPRPVAGAALLCRRPVTDATLCRPTAGSAERTAHGAGGTRQDGATAEAVLH